jgi:hypothetical protein
MAILRNRFVVPQLGFAALFTLFGAHLAGCGSSDDGVNIGNGSGGAPSTSGGGPAVLFGGSPTVMFGGNTGTAGGSGTAGNTGNGMPEICDGIDNDANGIIDDRDVGNDGVCDCLNIATLGTIGPWSNGGNVFAAWLSARSPMGSVSLGDQVVTEDLLRPFQIVVSLHVGTMAVQGNNNRNVPANHAFSDAEAAAFLSWVNNGGGAMTTIGYSPNEAQEVVNVNKLLATVGLGYSPTNTQLNGLVNTWMQHPVTMGIRSINTQNGTEPADGGTTLATGSGQRLALKVAESGKGKVIVWGDEWITYDSEWVDTDQQVELFWVNILKWLSPANRCQVPIPPDIIR